MAYATSFLAIASAFSHTFLWHGKDIYIKFMSAKDSVHHHSDIHNTLMLAYPQIPDSVFLMILGSFVIFQIGVSMFTPFTMPIWSILLCIVLVAASILPIGIITAVTGQRLGLNVLTEFVIGLLIPSQTVAVMAFKSLGTNAVIQAIELLADLKLGHYMKINPYHILFAQLYGTLIGAVVNTLCSFWIMENMNGVLGNGDWQMSGYNVFYNAGAIWGAIGTYFRTNNQDPQNSLRYMRQRSGVS